MNQEEPQLDELYVQAMLLAKIIGGILRDRGSIKLSAKPTFKRRPIVEFMKRMRVSSIDKFDDTTYIATVNFFRNKKALDKNNPLGTLVLYLGSQYIKELFKRLDYPLDDDDDDKALQDASGTFCNIVAGNFKTALVDLGYVDLEMSHFSTYRHEVLEGVPYNTNETEMFEIDFEIQYIKRIVAELTMGPVSESKEK